MVIWSLRKGSNKISYKKLDTVFFIIYSFLCSAVDSLRHLNSNSHIVHREALCIVIFSSIRVEGARETFQ
jgi:hypothetical protein